MGAFSGMVSEDDPHTIARHIVEAAINAKRKEDDVSCAVGIVTSCR